MSKKQKLGTVGADLWLNKNGYNKGPGLKQWKKTEKDRPEKIKRHHKERALNGYSTFDWWNFDTFIAGVIASGVLKFAEESMGFFPMGDETVDGNYNYPEGTNENYVATCGAIYYALTEYLGDDETNIDEYQVRYDEAKEALHIFAEYFGNFWD